MTDAEQKELGKTLWAIADYLRGAMNANDFRNYMLSFLFLRYLSDNYEASTRKEFGRDYVKLERETPLSCDGYPLVEVNVLNALITTQAQKVDGLKAYKKGLIRQLFPAADEVNA